MARAKKNKDPPPDDASAQIPSARKSPRLDKKARSRESLEAELPVAVLQSQQRAKAAGLDAKFASDMSSIYVVNKATSVYAGIPTAKKFIFEQVASTY